LYFPFYILISVHVQNHQKPWNPMEWMKEERESFFFCEWGGSQVNRPFQLIVLLSKLLCSIKSTTQHALKIYSSELGHFFFIIPSSLQHTQTKQPPFLFKSISFLFFITFPFLVFTVQYGGCGKNRSYNYYFNERRNKKTVYAHLHVRMHRIRIAVAFSTTL